MPKLEPIQSNIRLKVLANDQLADIKQSTLQVLEQVGVRFPSQKALEIFSAHGADVNFQSQVAKLPSGLVLDAMQNAPRKYTLAARSPENDLHLSGDASYFCTDGVGTMTLDFDTSEIRPSSKQDVADLARVSDYLPSVSYYWPMVSAQDFGLNAPLHELEASLLNTSKHVQSATLTTPHLAETTVRIAQVLAGGEDKMRLRPPISALICTLAPLGQDAEAIEAAMIYAQAGLPVGFMSMPTLGSTSPATIASALTIGNAEVVSAIVLTQLIAPGAPVFHSILASVMDPHTAAYITSIPEKYLCNLAAVQLAHDWNIPSLAGAFGLDHSDPGTWELGRDQVYTAMMVPMVGADLVVAFGLLRASTLLVPEQIILDDETYRIHAGIAAGIDTSTEALALDTIAAVGPRGHFLSQKHTRKHLHEIWIPPLSHPRPWESVNNGDDIRKRARRKYRSILDQHKPEPMNEEIQLELRSILADAAQYSAI